MAARIGIALTGVTVFLLLVSSAFFAPRKGGVDEVTLMNPVYMKLTTGRLTYPAHGFFDGMYVHPPVHVSEVALLRGDRKSTRLNSSHIQKSRMPSSA